jgi:hypothetical protein
MVIGAIGSIHGVDSEGGAGLPLSRAQVVNPIAVSWLSSKGTVLYMARYWSGDKS